MFVRPSASRLGVFVAAAAVALAACGSGSGGSSEAGASGDAGQAEVALETAPDVESAVVESTTTSTSTTSTTSTTMVTTATTPEPPPETTPEPDPTAAPVTDATPVSTESSQPVSTGVPVGYRPIFDESGDLRSNVPATWLETDGVADGDVRQLAAAPDLAGFLAGYTLPGMLLLSGPAATPDVWTAGLSAALGVAEGDGCVVSDTSDYSDGVYTGTEHVLTCGAADTTAHLIGGRDADGDLFFLLAIIRPITDQTVRDEIVQSFFID